MSCFRNKRSQGKTLPHVTQYHVLFREHCPLFGNFHYQRQPSHRSGIDKVVHITAILIVLIYIFGFLLYLTSTSIRFYLSSQKTKTFPRYCKKGKTMTSYNEDRLK